MLPLNKPLLDEEKARHVVHFLSLSPKGSSMQATKVFPSSGQLEVERGTQWKRQAFLRTLKYISGANGLDFVAVYKLIVHDISIELSVQKLLN